MAPPLYHQWPPSGAARALTRPVGSSDSSPPVRPLCLPINQPHAAQFFHNSSLSCVFPTVFLVPSPGQLTQRVQSIGNFSSTPRQQLKATAYVSPTVQQGPTSTSLSTSASLSCILSSTALPQPLKASGSLLPHALKTGINQSAAPRSSLPRPASLVGASGLPRASKIMQPTRRYGPNRTIRYNKGFF